MLFFHKRGTLPRLIAPACAAVIVAAGQSSRMNGIDKIMAPLGGEPLVLHTLRTFDTNAFVQEIVVVTREELIVPIAELCRSESLSKVRLVLLGGDTRLDSVRAGLDGVSGKAKLVAVHDGARPLVPDEVITAAILKAAETGAAAPALPVKDTVKIAERGFVTGTPTRSSLFLVQTPQVFDRDLLAGALQKAAQDGAEVTDDCSAVERMGMRVALTKGSEDAVKITTPHDFLVAEAILSGRAY